MPDPSDWHTHSTTECVCVWVCEPLPPAHCSVLRWRCAQVANGNFQPLRRGLCPLCLNFKSVWSEAKSYVLQTPLPHPLPLPPPLPFVFRVWPTLLAQNLAAKPFKLRFLHNAKNPKPSRECEYTHSHARRVYSFSVSGACLRFKVFSEKQWRTDCECEIRI